MVKRRCGGEGGIGEQKKKHKIFSITLPSVEASALPVCCPGCVWNASREQSKPWAHPKGLCGQSLVKRLFTAPANTVYSLSLQFCRSSHCVPTHITHSRGKEEKQGKTNEKLWVAALLGAHPHSKAQELPQTHTRRHTSLPANNCYWNTYLLLLPAHPATSNGVVLLWCYSNDLEEGHPIPYHHASCKAKKKILKKTLSSSLK